MIRPGYSMACHETVRSMYEGMHPFPPERRDSLCEMVSPGHLNINVYPYSYLEVDLRCVTILRPSPSDDLLLSVASLLGAGSTTSVSSSSSSSASATAESPPFEASPSAFFSFSFASSPSTRFSNASRTSVFGPRFLGTASVLSYMSKLAL